MWQRIIHEQWTTIIPIISFIVTFSVFLFVTIRAILLPKKRRERLASIPLEDKPTTEVSENDGKAVPESET